MTDNKCKICSCKIKCEDVTDCDQSIYGLFKCQVDPQSVEHNKVCIDIDGMCSNLDCDDDDYQCIRLGHLNGYCLRYQDIKHINMKN